MAEALVNTGDVARDPDGAFVFRRGHRYVFIVGRLQYRNLIYRGKVKWNGEVVLAFEGEHTWTLVEPTSIVEASGVRLGWV